MTISFSTLSIVVDMIVTRMLPRQYVKPEDVLSARLIPRAGGQYFELEVLYQEHTPQQASGAVTAGIDIGINNLYTIAFDDFSDGLIVSGKPLTR